MNKITRIYYTFYWKLNTYIYENMDMDIDIRDVEMPPIPQEDLEEEENLIHGSIWLHFHIKWNNILNDQINLKFTQKKNIY